MHISSARLLKIAEFIKNGERVADIGTDHGFLPIYLVKSGISPFVIASDIKEKPLKSAINNAKKAGTDQIDFRLCDGLSSIGKDEVDAVIIAGMGGECIAGILNSSLWAQNSGKHFILNPMNSPEKLREFLYNSGFSINSEYAVEDSGKIYTVLDVYATPDIEKRGEDFYYLGKLSATLPCDRRFLEKQYIRLYSCANELKNTEKCDEFLKVSAAADYIKQFLGV